MPEPSATPAPLDPAIKRWRDLANQAYLVAEQWAERTRALEMENPNELDLPPEPSLAWPAATPGTADFHRQCFEYHDARGKAWRARAQALEVRRAREAARSTPTPAATPVYSAPSAAPTSDAARTRHVSGYTRKDGTYVQSYRRR